MHSKASLLFLILTATFRSAEVRKDWVHSSCLILWRRCKSYLLGTRAYLLASRCPQRSTAIGAQYTEAPSQEVRHEIRSREINQTSNVENPDARTNGRRSPCLRFSAGICTRRSALWRAWRWPFRRAWWSLWWPKRASWRSCRQHAWTDYNGHNDAGSLHASESLPPTDQIWEDCPNSARSSGRRFQPKRPGTGSNPGLSSVALNWRKN